jgi:uncharacterized membrane protein
MLTYAAVHIYNAIYRPLGSFVARQVYLVAGASVMVGAVTGVLYSLFGVDVNFRRFAYEEWIAAALCAVSGAAVGWGNATAVDDAMEITFDELPMEDA